MDTDIHPSAILAPGVEIGLGVRIGPYCVIAGGVRIGDGCHLHHHVSVGGPGEIGARNEFYPFASIGQRSQDLKYKGEPTHYAIGDENTFREFVTIHRGTSPGSVTRIGSGGNFLAYSHVAHDCIVGDRVIFSNNGTIGGHVTVEDHAIISGLSAVHQFCRIGRFAITGGCSKIVQDVPPYMIADGNPAEARGINQVGLERHGYLPEAIRKIKEAYRVLYRSKLNTSQAVDELKERGGDSEEIRHLITFIQGSERGIVR